MVLPSNPDATVPVSALRPVKFGLVPTTRELRDESLLTELARALGPLWSVHTFPSYASLVDALGNGTVDMAWLPPLAYARAAQAGAADLLFTLTRAGQPSYASAIIVRAIPEASDLSYVMHKRAGWVDAWSAAGYLVARAVLRAAGIDPTRAFSSQVFLGSHSAVVEAVARGTVDVGATYCSVDGAGRVVRSAWSNEPRVRALALSDPIPGDTICLSPRVGAREGRIMAARLSELEASPAGRSLMARVFGADCFVPGEPSRYRALEAALSEDAPEE